MSQMLMTAEPVFTGVPASIVCQPETFSSLLPAHWQTLSAAGKTAWISLWSQWYFAGTLLGWADQLCSEHQSCPLWEFRGQLQINDRGCPEHWLNRGNLSGSLSESQKRQQLDLLIHRFIAPVCQTLAVFAANNLTVFWSNAAVRLWQGMQRAIEKQADVRVLQEIFSAPRLADDQVNRLYSPLRRMMKEDGSEQMQRRHCCLIFRLDEFEKCPSCPLQKCSKN